ncbi:T-protein [Rhodobacteraceae bacterium THAF1]|uniref:chorismate mutase n=1 Tax=Palleronia sp. THAF1 TaxID=2587842 RepID=UPI000F3F6A8B|nr:chorismate mutase [Palleronia sp. THAF1]QFU07810.1 T-protein [Palleronia sp. THAF1]VDC25625.1 T-protein [Rhodobacteraceae bacterium THAF1]
MTDLQTLRDRIDQLDAILIHTLAERFRNTDQVGALKATGGLPPLDESREAQQRARIEALAEETGVDPALALQILALVVDRVKDNHRKISGDQ